MKKQRKKETGRGKKRGANVAEEKLQQLRISGERRRKILRAAQPVLLASWFELHQLKKVVPQKFHNATGGGLRQMSLHVRPLSISTGQ